MALLKLTLLCLALLLSSQSEAGALATIGSDLASPVTTPARYILVGGVVATSLAYATRTHRTYRKRETFGDAKPLGDLGFIGDYIGYGALNLGYMGLAYWYGEYYDDADSRLNAELMMRATSYTFTLTMIGKNLISERRPGYPDDDQSFPSGHASASFAFASVVTARHGWGWGSLAHAMAGFITVSRVNDDFHYLHDILAGITIGASYGWGVHYNAQKGRNLWFSLLPVERGGLGFALGTQF